MKLNYLHLSQWRQFHASLAIEDLNEGINLFVGPNESGKSTLVGAIQAAFFERHKSSSVQHLQPWGDSSAEPAVSLAFDWQGATWKLDKRFLGHPRCDLVVAGEHVSGDEAEDKLSELMGYRLAKKGASKLEHHGIPGLLWVEQGTIQSIQGPVEHAGKYLQSAIGDDLGAVTSSSGDWLLAKVVAMRDESLTKGGKPRGDYKKVGDELDAARAQLDALDSQVTKYENKVDELARRQQDQQKIDSTKPWVAQREKAQQAQVKREGIRELQNQQEQSRHTLEDCTRQQDLVRDKLKGFANSAIQLKQRAADKVKAQATFDDCVMRQSGIEDRQRKAQAACNKAVEAFKQAREQAHRARLDTQYRQLAKTLKVDHATLVKLEKLQGDLRQLRDARQTASIDTDGLKRLKKLRQSLDKLALREEMLATRLSWHLEPGAVLTLGEEFIDGEGETLLIKATELSIPDVGTLQLEPGGADIAGLARQQSQLEIDYTDLLAALGIKDLAEGEQRVVSCIQLDGSIKRGEERLGDLAPDGVDALAEQVRLAEGRQLQLAEQLDACPPAQPDAADESGAEQSRDDAQTALETADNALQDHKQELGLAKQALKNAQDEWQHLEAECSSPDRKQQEQAANRELTDLKAKQQTLESGIDQRQATIDAAQPELLEDDIQRFTDSAVALESAARDRERAIDRLLTELETLGAQGLEDQRNELEQAVDRLQARHDELTRRAQALDLLSGHLQDKRQALTRKLQAPLQKHLDHYLKLLFPEATIRVDEHLVPSVLVRNAQHGDMADLSYGAREQMGLVSRLAYADLLREKDQPTLLILDDALVHSDASRLAQMKRILFDAAKRHQVLLFTCHPDNWDDLGVAARDLETLKVAAA